MKIIRQVLYVLFAMLFIYSNSVVALDEQEVYEPKVISLSVPTMNCAMCVVTIARSLMNVDGVETADTNSYNKTVNVGFNNKVTNIKSLMYATKIAGYPSYLIDKQNNL